MALNCSPSSHSKSGESKNREGKPQDSWGTVSQAAWFLPGVDTLNRHQRPSFRQQRARLGHQMSVLSERSGGSTVCRADQRNTHALSLGAGTTRAQSLAICIQARHPGYPGISVKPWDVRKEPENLPFTPSCHFTAEAQTERNGPAQVTQFGSNWHLNPNLGSADRGCFPKPSNLPFSSGGVRKRRELTLDKGRSVSPQPPAFLPGPRTLGGWRDSPDNLSHSGRTACLWEGFFYPPLHQKEVLVWC